MLNILKSLKLFKNYITRVNMSDLRESGDWRRRRRRLDSDTAETRPIMTTDPTINGNGERNVANMPELPYWFQMDARFPLLVCECACVCVCAGAANKTKAKRGKNNTTRQRRQRFNGRPLPCAWFNHALGQTKTETKAGDVYVCKYVSVCVCACVCGGRKWKLRELG